MHFSVSSPNGSWSTLTTSSDGMMTVACSRPELHVFVAEALKLEKAVYGKPLNLLRQVQKTSRLVRVGVVELQVNVCRLVRVRR